MIVAVDDDEVPRLMKLFERGKENGVRDLRLIGTEELKQLEPHCQVVNLPAITTWGAWRKWRFNVLVVFPRARWPFTPRTLVSLTGGRWHGHMLRILKLLGDTSIPALK